MAKTFYTSGTGSQQTLTGSQNEKVAVYQTLADAEADLANLEAGQIVATPDTGDELAQPVNEVTANNLHSVTSGAVAGAFEWELISSDDVTLTVDTAGSSSTAFTPVYRHIYKCKNLIKMALAVTTTEAIPAPVGNGNMRFYVQINGIVPTSNLSTISTLAYVNDEVVPITVAYSSSITPNGWRVTFRYNDALNSGSTFGFYTVMAI